MTQLTKKMAERRILSFVRRVGHKISNERQDALDNFLPKILVDEKNAANFWRETGGKFKELHLEIGFGTGEHFIKRAELNHNILYLGAEPFINGTSRTVKEIKQKFMENVRIYPGDIYDLLPILPDDIFSEAWVLFPDPWPKSKHHKRRIINEEFLQIMHKKLTKNGKLIVATDHLDYASWIKEHLEDSPYFDLTGGDDLQLFPENWIPSKYYQKATQAGRMPFYFESIRKDS